MSEVFSVTLLVLLPDTCMEVAGRAKGEGSKEGPCPGDTSTCVARHTQCRQDTEKLFR